MFLARLQSTTVLMIAPLWEMNAMLPGLGDWWTYVVSMPRGGMIMPRQFGPMIRVPWLRAMETIRSSRAFPCSPISLNPAVMMTAIGTPLAPHSSMTRGTWIAGTVMTARSTGAGMDVMFGYAFSPWISGRLLFTG